MRVFRQFKTAPNNLASQNEIHSSLECSFGASKLVLNQRIYQQPGDPLLRLRRGLGVSCFLLGRTRSAAHLLQNRTRSLRGIPKIISGISRLKNKTCDTLGFCCLNMIKAVVSHHPTNSGLVAPAPLPAPVRLRGPGARPSRACDLFRKKMTG